MPFDRAREFTAKRATITAIIKLHIIDIYPLFAQRFREMPHRRQDEHDLLRVMRHIARFIRHLDHQNDVVLDIKISQR